MFSSLMAVSGFLWSDYYKFYEQAFLQTSVTLTRQLSEYMRLMSWCCGFQTHTSHCNAREHYCESQKHNKAKRVAQHRYSPDKRKKAMFFFVL